MIKAAMMMERLIDQKHRISNENSNKNNNNNSDKFNP
jgi:hypothetical protein